MLKKQMKIYKNVIPQIYDILGCLCKAQVFSKTDLSKAYHQVAVKLSHMHKTALLSEYGLFKFQILPFGLFNAPVVF